MENVLATSKESRTKNYPASKKCRYLDPTAACAYPLTTLLGLGSFGQLGLM